MSRPNLILPRQGFLRREAVLLGLLGFAAVFFAYRWAVYLDRPGIPKAQHPEGWRLFHDQRYYLLEAQRLGKLRGLPHTIFLYGPGYPVLAAPFANIGRFGWPFQDPFMLANGVIWLLTVAATFLVARRLYGEVVGLVAALALILATPLIVNVVLPWNSTACLGALMVTMLVALERRLRWWHGVFLGLALAWAYSARYVDALWVALAVLAILVARGAFSRNGVGTLFATAGGGILGVVPTLYLQWMTFGSPLRTAYSTAAVNPVTAQNFALANIWPHALQTFVSPWLFPEHGARSYAQPLLSSMFLIVLAPAGWYLVARRSTGARRILVIGFGFASLAATIFYLSYNSTGSYGITYGSVHYFKMWWPLWVIGATGSLVETYALLRRKPARA